MYRVGLYIISTLFLCFLLIYISLHFNVFILVYVTFLAASRCMFELKFAIYHRAASLSSQASYTED